MNLCLTTVDNSVQWRAIIIGLKVLDCLGRASIAVPRNLDT